MIALAVLGVIYAGIFLVNQRDDKQNVITQTNVEPKEVGSYVEFGAIGPVPDGVTVPIPGVTYVGSPQERADAAAKHLLENKTL